MADLVPKVSFTERPAVRFLGAIIGIAVVGVVIWKITTTVLYYSDPDYLHLSGKNGEEIRVNNFLRTRNPVLQRADTDDWIIAYSGPRLDPFRQVSYDKDSETFTILVNAESVLEVQQRGENELIEALGVPKSTLCKLKILVKGGYGIRKSLRGKEFDLTFC